MNCCVVPFVFLKIHFLHWMLAVLVDGREGFVANINNDYGYPSFQTLSPRTWRTTWRSPGDTRPRTGWTGTAGTPGSRPAMTGPARCLAAAGGRCRPRYSSCSIPWSDRSGGLCPNSTRTTTSNSRSRPTRRTRTRRGPRERTCPRLWANRLPWVQTWSLLYTII